MAVARVNLYEGMFLLSTKSSADLPAALEFIKGVFVRAEAEVLVLRKWDERKMAYAIRGQKRGVYILSYFKCRGTQVANIERDCNLSEEVTRALIVAADHMGEVELELAKKEVPAAVDARLRAPDDRGRQGDDRGRRPAGKGPAGADVLPDIEVPPEAGIDALGEHA